MTITTRGIGTIGTGSTTVQAGLSGSAANGDAVLLFVFTKPDTAVVVPPTNWLTVANVSGGGGTTGAGVGPTLQAVFFREKDASWSTMPTVTITNGNSSAAVSAAFGKTEAEWAIAAATSTYGSAATTTNGAATLGSNPGITAGDRLVVGYSSMSVTPTWSAQGVTATGITLGAVLELSEAVETTTNNDVGGMVFVQTVSSGTVPSTAVPSTQATASAATRGTIALVRIRETPATPSEITWDGTGLADNTVLANGTAGTGDTPITATFAAGTHTYDADTGYVTTDLAGTAGAFWWQLATRSSRRYRFYLELPASSPPTNALPFAGIQLQHTTTYQARLQLQPAANPGALRIVNYANTAIFTSADNYLPLGQGMCRYEAIFNQAAGTTQIKCWNLAGTQLFDTGVINGDIGASHDRFAIGASPLTNTLTFKHGHYKASTDLATEIGPIAGSGTEHTVTPTDLAGLADSSTVARALGQTVTDLTGLVDSSIVSLADIQPATDSTGLADSATVVLARSVAATDPVGLTDGATVAQAHTSGLQDTLGLADSATPVLGLARVATDAVGLADAATAGMGLAATAVDLTGLADAASVVVGRALNEPAADPVGLTDSFKAVMGLGQAATDPTGMADSAIVALADIQSVTDAVGLFDSSASALSMPVTVTDLTGLTDSAKVVSDRSQSATDSAGLADTSVVSLTDVQTATDSAGLVDSSTASIARSVATVDSTGLSDSASVAQGGSANAADSVGLTDRSTVASAQNSTATDSAGLTDTAVVVLTGAGQLDTTDSVGLADAAAMSMELVVAASDNLALSDAANVQQGLGRSTVDPVGLADGVVVSRVLAAPWSDSAGIADSASVVQSAATGVEQSDGVGLVDSVEVVLHQAIRAADSAGLADRVDLASDDVMSLSDLAGLTDSAIVSMLDSELILDGVGLADSASVVVRARYTPATDPSAEWDIVMDNDSSWARGRNSASILGGTSSAMIPPSTTRGRLIDD